jgi:hypothetical protein
MRCLFCKADSSSSRSIEHIVPESMGNLSYVLPAGVVCDNCNNYFSRKVEKPFLECDAISLLRFHQEVPNKKGRVPPVTGLIAPGYVPVTVWRRPGSREILVDVPPGAAGVLKAKEGRLILPASAQFPSGPLVSRFLAKVALEAMAAKLVAHPDGLEYLVDEEQLDPIRNHARRGEFREWPTHIRSIYDQDAKWLGESNSELQVVHEFDILNTDSNEWFFVIALFGLEFAINYGGPDIEGYHLWLVKHGNASPLYTGKNATDKRLRRSRS